MDNYFYHDMNFARIGRRCSAMLLLLVTKLRTLRMHSAAFY